MYTVAELIETLKQCPQDYRVAIRNEHLFSEYGIAVVGIDHEEKTVDIFTE